MAQSNFDSELSNVTNAIEQLEESLKRSFVHSTPKTGVSKGKIIKRKSDSGVSNTLYPNEQSDNTVLVGTDLKGQNSTSHQINFEHAETLPLSYTPGTKQSKNDQSKKSVKIKEEKLAIDNGVKKEEKLLENDKNKPFNELARSKEIDKSKERNSNQGVKCKPATYDGLSSWIDFKSHFDMVAIINDWSEIQKGLYLAVSLRGPAQAILGDLPSELRSDYETLTSALEERFSLPSQTELYRVQFRERRKKASESLPEMGQSISRLANLAYPTAPRDVREIPSNGRLNAQCVA